MAKRPIEGIRTIVTGASSGIGRALALGLMRRGASCVAVARRQERLESLREEAGEAAGRLHLMAGDVTDPDLRRRVIELAGEELGGLDLLVNNAGVGAMGRFEDGHAERLRSLMEVNVFALAEMTRLALPLLRKEQGCIVNVGSIVGLRGAPHNSEYSATKFAVTGLTESLRAELAADGIDVLLVSPGTTQTEFFDQLIEKTSEASFPDHPAVTAEYVAERTIWAIERGHPHIVPYARARLLYLLNRLSPRLTDWIMARYA